MPDPCTLTREKAIHRFQNALLRVAPDYFSVVLPDGNEAHQERIFAYELYHQMRLEFNGAWYVNGEFRKGLRLIPRVGREDWVIPDLVVHQSANVESNLLVVEIKSSPNLNAGGLIEDLKKLEMFTNPHRGLGFSIGIMLIVNSCFTEILERADEVLKEEIAQLLATGPRVAIWNIAAPTPNDQGNHGDGRLVSGRLKIFKADRVRELASNHP